MDITPKGKNRLSLDEVGLHTVQNGKIVEERFFMVTSQCSVSSSSRLLNELRQRTHDLSASHEGFARGNVRFGSKAAIFSATAHVRFGPIQLGANYLLAPLLFSFGCASKISNAHKQVTTPDNQTAFIQPTYKAGPALKNISSEIMNKNITTSQSKTICAIAIFGRRT